MPGLSVVGKSVIRVDALDKVTGTAIYCSDISLPRMLLAKVLRSPYPHARIENIDTSKAEKLAGVACVITGRDVPERRFGEVIRDQHVLAKDVVRAVGDPVVAVAAATADIADEALELIDVEYEELPAIFDPEEAMSTNPTVIIHPELAGYEAEVPVLRRLDVERPNVFMYFKIRHGDVGKGFHEADIVMESRFSTARIQHVALECHTTIAQSGTDGGLTVWTNKQTVQHAKMQLSHLFDMKPSKIRLIQPYIGGAFGATGALHEEPIVVLLALKTGRAVKQVFSREEVFSRGGTRAPMVINIKDGVKSDGRIVAREMTAVLAGGGYGERCSAIVTRNAAFAAVGTYKTPNLKWDSYGVYVNEPPATPFRGFGNMEVTWAIESHMDMLAKKLDIDPVQMRRVNLLHEGDVNATGEITHSIGAQKCLERLVKCFEPAEKPERQGIWQKGRGIAIGNKYSLNPSASIARVKINEDGSVVVFHGAEEIGAGCDTVMTQIAAEEFGISVNDVNIAYSDTLYMPYDYGSVSSRSTHQTGNAVRLACQDAKRQIRERSALILGTLADDLEVTGGNIFVKGVPEKNMRVSDLFIGASPGRYGTHIKDGEITGNAVWAQDFAPEDRETGQINPELAVRGLRLNAFYAHITKAVEVAVNTETGEVKVLKCFAAADMGQPINPKMCEQQADGGIGMGIGSAIYEEVKVRDGVVTNSNLTDYKVTTACDMPGLAEVQTAISSVPHKDGPYGAKGFAEGAMIGMDAAIANAVYNAVGIRIKDLPINAERVLKAIMHEKVETK